MRRLQKYQVPPLFCILLWWIRARSGASSCRDYIMVEYFSGQGELWKAFNREGFPSAGFDIKNDPVVCNMMSAIGFLEAMQWSRRIAAGNP